MQRGGVGSEANRKVSVRGPFEASMRFALVKMARRLHPWRWAALAVALATIAGCPVGVGVAGARAVALTAPRLIAPFVPFEASGGP